VESQISLIKDVSIAKIAAVLYRNRYRILNALVERMYKSLGQCWLGILPTLSVLLVVKVRTFV